LAQHTACDVDVVAFALDVNEQVPGDEDFVFYGAPEHPDGTVRLAVDGPTEQAVTADLERLPLEIRRVVIAAAIDGALFAAYAAGMGLIVGAASLTVALTRTTAVTRLRRFGALAPRIGGGLLLLVGTYVAYYGWYEIRVQHDPATTDPIIDAAGAVQRSIADTLDDVGPATIAALCAALLLAAVVIGRRRRTHRSAHSELGAPPAPGHTGRTR
jgi:hypothetical protein